MIDAMCEGVAAAQPTDRDTTWPNADLVSRRPVGRMPAVCPEPEQAASRPLAEGVLDAVGQTPTVRLSRLGDLVSPSGRVELFAKCEFCNPAGSMKDRPSAAMLADALADGRLRPGMTVVESSSGNMGIGLAQACAYHGLRFVCVVDPRTQATNISVMRAYGAEIDLVEQPDPATGDFLTARLGRVRELVATSDDAFWPNQYANPTNPRAHEEGTARELHEAAGPLDLLLVATSTTGTINGCRDYFARVSPNTRVVAVDAAGSVLFGGTAGQRAISGLGAGLHPPLSRRVTPDDVLRVTDLDCVVGCRQLVRAEAILAGGSAGGLITAVQRMQLAAGTRVGMIFADHGGRYLQTVYDDAWVERTTGCGPDELRRRVDSFGSTDPATDRGWPNATADATADVTADDKRDAGREQQTATERDAGSRLTDRNNRHGQVPACVVRTPRPVVGAHS